MAGLDSEHRRSPRPNAGSPAAEPGPQRVVELPLDQLTSHPDQPRRHFEELSLRDLALSVKLHGLLQPIVVQKRPDEQGYWVVAGERRRRAVRLLGRTTIPTIVTRGNPDELSLIENIQRESLSPIEEAEAMARLMARHGYTQEELARVVGKARPTVTRLLKLTSLPEVIKEESATSHQVSRSVLIEIAQIADRDEQLAQWEAAKGGATVQAVRRNRGPARNGPRSGGVSPFGAVLSSGRIFLERLRRSVLAETPPPASEVEALVALHREIDGLIRECHIRAHGAVSHPRVQLREVASAEP